MKYQFNTCIWVIKAKKMKPRQTVLSLLASLLTQYFPRTIEEVTQRCIPKFVVLTLWYAYTGVPPGMRKWARCTRLRRASQLQCNVDRGDESQILLLRKLIPNMEIRNWAVAPHCRARFISSHADYSLLRVNGVTDIECTHRVLSVPLSHPAPLRIRMREMTLAGRKDPDSKVCMGNLVCLFSFSKLPKRPT